MTKGLLNGIRVLDFGQFIAGPYCAKILGAMGADVIRVERFSGATDRTLLGFDDDESSDGAFYSCVNTNKRSVAIDLLADNSRAITDKLVSTADIIVANMPEIMLKKLGIDQASLNALGSKAILVTCSAYGGDAEQKAKLGFDGIGQALSGAMHMTGEDGQSRKAFVHYVDYFTAAISAVGAVVSLREREKTGAVNAVEASLLGSALAMMNASLAEEAVRKIDRTGTGNLAQSAAPANVYNTQNGAIILQVVGISMFKRWTKLVGKPDWGRDPQYATDAKRAECLELEQEAQAWFAARTSEEALDLLAQFNLPASPICSPRQTLVQSDVVNGGFLKQGRDPSGRFDIPLVKAPIKLAGQDLNETDQAPQLGQNTAEILRELNFSDAEMSAFVSDGLILTTDGPHDG